MVTGDWSCRRWAISCMVAGFCAVLVQGQVPGEASGGGVRPAGEVRSPYDGQPVRAVRIVGNREVSETFIRTQIVTREGQPFSREQLEQDLRRLAGTGQFAVAPVGELVEADGGLEVMIRVVERQAVVSVSFPGAKELRVPTLQTEAGIRPGEALNPALVEAGASAIRAKYREEGFYFAEVNVDATELEAGRVVYRIAEGPRVRIRSVLFEGNTQIDDELLKVGLESQEYFFLLAKGALDEERIDRDINKIRNQYVDEGFLEAKVSHRIEFSDGLKDARLIFMVEEGLQYRVGAVLITGNRFFEEALLRELISIQPGDVAAERTIRRDREAVLAKYTRNGLIDTQVRTLKPFTERAGEVDLTFVVSESAGYKFGEILIVGNRKTQDKVILRELRFFPDQPYNLPETQEAERRLRSTRYFSQATITPAPSELGLDYRDAVVRVQEADNTTRLLFGAGVSSNDGLVGSISLENTNFDLMDWPRDGGEFFSGNSFKGAGQTFRLLFEPGTELFRARMDFVDPYFMDWPVRFGYSLYFFDRNRDEWDERRIGQTVSFGRELEGIRLLNKELYAELTWRMEYVTISDRELFAAKDIRDMEGGNFLMTLRPALIRDTTDSLFDPTRGSRLTLSWEQEVVNYMYADLRAKYVKYFTIGRDLLDRKSVLALNVEVGHILGDAPPFERYFAGGINSLRGFRYRTISPRKGLRDSRVGGDTLLLFGAEYSFPLIGKEIRGVTFTDMGTVSEGFSVSDFRASVGVGLRVQVEQITGPVPLSFDLAFPILKGDGDQTEIFSFNVGATFR